MLARGPQYYLSVGLVAILDNENKGELRGFSTSLFIRIRSRIVEAVIVYRCVV